MPKRSPNDCLFCGTTPCSCNGKVAKPQKTKVTSDLDRMRERAARRVEKPVAAPVEHRASDIEAEFAQAIKVLAPILNRDELEKYRGIAGLHVSYELHGRVQRWRKVVSSWQRKQDLPAMPEPPSTSVRSFSTATDTAGGESSETSSTTSDS